MISVEKLVDEIFKTLKNTNNVAWLRQCSLQVGDGEISFIVRLTEDYKIVVSPIWTCSEEDFNKWWEDGGEEMTKSICKDIYRRYEEELDEVFARMAEGKYVMPTTRMVKVDNVKEWWKKYE